MKGNLTMHGKTKLVSIPFKVAKGKNGAGVDTTTYKGKLTVNRNDFGIGTDSVAAKISLEDEVDLKLLIVTFPVGLGEPPLVFRPAIPILVDSIAVELIGIQNASTPTPAKAREMRVVEQPAASERPIRSRAYTCQRPHRRSVNRARPPIPP